MKFKCKIKNNDINSYNITKMHTDFQKFGVGKIFKCHWSCTCSSNITKSDIV